MPPEWLGMLKGGAVYGMNLNSNQGLLCILFGEILVCGVVASPAEQFN
jgi:hypothetical protein